ncbi:RNA polymerase sigma-70 factor [Pedobacter sp. MC2016-14]|uniref:RNA polymerase sigma-70 factor n=1 Tax=Pedobacter sp. MC2016-14 TaxID=2897327 RepID=UPI001E4B421B|nr:RNA polymerase sigma-70 factor [Pedobacter sp. MC2016-14]MCD0486988.1 RNA polymerase sigma-70 factor [Pedobacter sp. MC2016-14]
MALYHEYTDHQLTHLLVKDDEKAFTQVFKRYNSLLYAHAYKKLGSREEAKDIVQEIFAVLWSKRLELNVTTSLSGYLFTAVRNRIFDFIAHQDVATRYIDSLQDFLNHGEAITDHLIREKQIREIIEKEISLLPPKMRVVFELSRKNYMSHKEIAENLGISEQTVTDQIKKALKILRKRMGLVVFFVFLTNY